MAIVVEYKGNPCLWYGRTKKGLAKLLTATGEKYSGTPSIDKLKIIKHGLPHAEFNNHRYVSTKQGVFSCSTGNKVSNPDILSLF